jgi:UDP-glucose 4-epimerase
MDTTTNGWILLTGGAGYVGSHTWLALQAAGYRVLGLDNFANSSPRVLERIERLGGQRPEFVRADVSDAQQLEAVFASRPIAGVVHFAAHKAVGESAARPLEYYANNIGGLLSLCATMRRHGCSRLVFSSSATVYGQPDTLPIREDARLSTASVYGSTKLMGENILRDLAAADTQWHIACLRYFNPVGAHPSGEIGEDPRGTPNNLMPYISQVAVGRRARLQVFGDDYPTADGTGVRDYIHVMDLAQGHVAALDFLVRERRSLTVNLGTGRGYSVLEVIRAFEAASGRPIPYDVVPRRPGDVAACYADPSLAREALGWSAALDLDRMCVDSWRWQQANPHGYGDGA